MARFEEAIWQAVLVWGVSGCCTPPLPLVTLGKGFLYQFFPSLHPGKVLTIDNESKEREDRVKREDARRNGLKARKRKEKVEER